MYSNNHSSKKTPWQIIKGVVWKDYEGVNECCCWRLSANFTFSKCGLILTILSNLNFAWKYRKKNFWTYLAPLRSFQPLPFTISTYWGGPYKLFSCITPFSLDHFYDLKVSYAYITRPFFLYHTNLYVLIKGKFQKHS